MECIILVTDSKDLIITKRINILKKEQNFMNIKFLFPLEQSGLNPVLQVILPDNVSGFTKKVQFEPENYKDHLVVNYVITEEMTNESGIVKLWFILTDESKQIVVKTNILKVSIGDTYVEIEPPSPPEDLEEAVEQLQNEVEQLKISKADQIKLDDSKTKVLLQSGDNVLSEVILPEEVIWES